jgi:cyclopropane-fatty-acyl-phospholipid synthase
MTPGPRDLASPPVEGSTDPTPGVPSAAPRAGRGGFLPWLIRSFLPYVRIPLRITLWNGADFQIGTGHPVALVHVRDRWTFWKLLLNPMVAFGDAYSDGRLEVQGDLVVFLERLFAANALAPRRHWLRRILTGWLNWPRINDLGGSRSNIHHHYDLGNDFYRLWLDDQLVYTCAYFPRPDLTLEQAQTAKMDHVCRKLGLQPGESVVEAGCGWGALARHMARHYGVRVTAYNISHEQIAYARERARAEGLDQVVQFVEDDYRQIVGRYDVFVSVGMLEHVGPANYRTLGGVIARCLAPEGRGLIHSIGHRRPGPTNPWLEKRIFPGAYMPSLSEMMAVFEPCGFTVLDVENLRLHYARTLEHWSSRFEAVADEVGRRFDPTFVRAWRLYLAASQASFLSGEIQLYQILFAPARNNQIPWSRAQVYEQEGQLQDWVNGSMKGKKGPWTAVTS